MDLRRFSLILGAMLLCLFVRSGSAAGQELAQVSDAGWVADGSSAPGWIFVEPTPKRRVFGLGRLFARPAPTAEGSPNVGLPRGRRYYNGRFFGELNNRYYGPQYGYF